MLNFTQTDDKIIFNQTENVFMLSHDVNSTRVKFFNSDTSKQSLGIVSISYVVIGAVGVLGNAFAILILFKFKGKNFFHLLLINQSFIDVTAATFLIALSSNTYNSFGNFGLAGKIYCFVWNNKVILWSLFLCSTLNLVVLNLERYLEVVYPIWHKVKLKRLHVYFTMVVVWLVGFAYNLVYKISSSYVQEGRCVHMKKWPSKTVQRFGGVLNALLYFFLPIIVMVYVTISIMRVLKERTKVANFSTVSEMLVINVFYLSFRLVTRVLHHKTTARFCQVRLWRCSHPLTLHRPQVLRPQT